MLILSRKKDESIIIGNHIEVKILAVEGEQVKLGIIAPKSVKVHRSEIFQAIQEQNKQALATDLQLLKSLNKSKFQ